MSSATVDGTHPITAQRVSNSTANSPTAFIKFPPVWFLTQPIRGKTSCQLPSGHKNHPPPQNAKSAPWPRGRRGYTEDHYGGTLALPFTWCRSSAVRPLVKPVPVLPPAFPHVWGVSPGTGLISSLKIVHRHSTNRTPATVDKTARSIARHVAVERWSFPPVPPGGELLQSTGHVPGPAGVAR